MVVRTSVSGELTSAGDSCRALVESTANIALYMLDTDGRVLTWNVAAERVKGFSGEEVIGRNFSMFSSPSAVADGDPEAALSLAASYGKYEAEGWRVRRDGSRYWASVVIDSLLDKDGKLIGFAKLVRDATETSFTAEQQRIISEAAPNGMLLIDSAGRVTLANSRAERLFAYRAGMLSGASMNDLLRGSGADCAELLQTWQAFDRGTDRSHFCAREVLTGHRADGSTFDAETAFSVAPTSRGPVIVASVLDISERRRFEHALVNANRLMSLVEEMAHTAHWRVDLRTKEITWSPELLRIYGRTEPPATIEAARAAFHPDDADVAAIVAQACLDGQPYQFESRLKRPDGSYRNIRVAGQPERDAAGTVVALVGFVQDITDERRAAEALRQVNRRMTLVEAMVHCGHWRIDLATREVTFSDEALRIHGIAASPSLDDGIAAFDSGTVNVRAIVQRALADGEPFSFEARARRPDGSYRDVRIAGQSEFGSDGRRTGLIGFVHDISDYRRSQNALESANRLMTMGEEMAQYGHWYFDLGSRQLIWSNEVYRIYGYEPHALPPVDDTFLVYGDRASEISAILRRAIGDGKPFGWEAWRARPDGTRRFVRVAGRGERDAAGSLIGLFGVVQDITDQKDAERERRWSTTFQRAVLPLKLPSIPGCRFDAVYDPGYAVAQVGGDWYDAVRLMDGRILVSIGDVCGSGLEAAVVVGVARQILRGVSQLHADPVMILDAADRALRLEYPATYVSAWVGVIDLVESTLTYASAGHPPPIAVSADGTTRELLDPTTLLIGLREGHRGHANVIRIREGDAFVLYTDGLTESEHDVLGGSLRVRDAAARFAVSAHERPAEAIKADVLPTGSSDDVAILVLQTSGREAERFMQRWTFDPLDAAAAGGVRRELLAWLRLRGLSDAECADAEVIYGELVGNAARYAGRSFEIVLDHSGAHVVMHALDRGPGFSYVRGLPADPYAEGGRGLFLVDSLTGDFTISRRTDGGSHARAVLAHKRLPHRRTDPV